MEKPLIVPTQKFGFFGNSYFQQLMLGVSQFKWDTDSSNSCKKREGFVLKQSVGSMVVVNACIASKYNFWKRFELLFSQKSLIAMGNFSQSIAGHLRAEIGKMFSEFVKAKMVKTDSIRLFIF